MGCCLTKKSRSRNKGLNETLLSGETGPDEEVVRAIPPRNHRNGYTPVHVPEEETQLARNDSTGVSLGAPRVGRHSSVVCIDGLDTVRKSNLAQARKVVGKSLLVLPSIKSLKKCGWLQKRGHMVSQV